MNPTGRREEIQKLLWSQRILVFALFLFAFALAAISLVSLFQTESSFRPLNDADVKIIGFAIGNYISVFFALAFQYGQNAALFIKNQFCKDRVILNGNIPFVGEFELKDTTLANGAFWVCAIIDATTNALWFYETVDIPDDVVRAWMIRVIGYSAMIASVFVEEVLGVALDALRKAWNQLREINRFEKRQKDHQEKSEKREMEREPEQSNKSYGAGKNFYRDEKNRPGGKPFVEPNRKNMEPGYSSSSRESTYERDEEYS